MTAQYFIDTNVLLYAGSGAIRYRLSYWDAAITVAARRLGCDILYSEDLNHGQDYDGVKVVNPFLAVANHLP